ncbi:VWA domain-containing protein, partial [Cronobacter turicensis]
GIYNSLPVVARALADQLDITVTVGGSDAYASSNGGKPLINIPFYKDAESLSDAILGFTIHEAAHIRFTEFDLLTPALNRLSEQSPDVKDEFGVLVASGRYNKKVLHSLWNIAEDLRIERSIVRLFPGSLRYLQAVRNFVFDGNIEPCDIPATIYLDAMLLCGRERYHGFNTHAEIRRNEFVSVFGQELLEKSLDVLGLAVLADSTLKCLDVARQLYDLAIDAFNQPNPDDENNAEENNPSDSNSPVDKSVKPASVHTDPFANAADADIDRAAKDISDKFNDLMQDKLTPSQRSKTVTPFRVAPAKTYETSNASVIRGIKASSGLRQSLNGLLQGMQHVRRTHKETGLKIDGRLISSVLTGNGKVFKHKSKTVALNSAFTVLLDSSGSMEGDIIEAEAAVISLLYALDNLSGVTTSAFHFPHSDGISVGKLKDRKQTLRQAITANHFGIRATGGTPLSSSLWPAIIDLVIEKADQSILIVATDGKPSHGTEQEVINIINNAKSDGIKVIGIGFGSANQSLMTRLFGNTGIAVGNLSNLRSALFDVARRALLNH